MIYFLWQFIAEEAQVWFCSAHCDGRLNLAKVENLQVINHL